jgi:hypothetical protein
VTGARDLLVLWGDSPPRALGSACSLFVHITPRLVREHRAQRSNDLARAGLDEIGDDTRDLLVRLRRLFEEQVLVFADHDAPEIGRDEIVHAVTFVISPAGSVLTSAATQSTLANPMLETCVANGVRRWMFPSPDGGGIVTVSYPFTFRAPE